MPLTLYNTLTRRKEPFETLEPGKVRMYCCGVTVYDYNHLGHARSYIVWDTVRRYLQWRGYDVQFVQNFTDIDDKIIKRSHEENLPWQEITEKYIQAYQDDMERLNILPADLYPRATESVPQIIDFIKALIEQGYAYVAAGDVYYAVERFPAYGKLSGRKLDQMEAGASGRVEDEEAKKRHPLDFALWKAAKPGEPEWDSPWGKGRPGWHIECSAMVREFLGDRIDIHTGGEDLVFPHHENEIAQSEAVIQQPLSRYWMHNGFVKIRGDKMSKSLKNFTTIRDILEVYDPMVVRLFVLQAHYTKPIDFTEDAMQAAQNGWQTLKEGLQFGKQHGKTLGWTNPEVDCSDRKNLSTEAVEAFQTTMDDDFNTSGGLAVLFELAKELRRESNLLIHEDRTDAKPQDLERQWRTLVCLAEVLGLQFKPKVLEASAISQGSSTATASAEILSNSSLVAGHITTSYSDEQIEAMIEQRNAARKAKNFAEADLIRNELQAQGITLIDQPGGITRWHRN
jgi:cysteinyl-tRNA synthetase